MKQALYKAVGSTKLTFKEFLEVLLEVHLLLNNRPLSYRKNDIQRPVFTPNMTIFGKPNYLIELSSQHIEEQDLPKRAKYLKIQRCAVATIDTKVSESTPGKT